MKTRTTNSKPALVLLMVCAFLFSANTFAQKVVEITGTNSMKFSVKQITVSPGEQVTIKLTTKSTLPAMAMSHNWVLLKQSADPQAFTMAGASHKDTEYIDPSKADMVLAKTALAAGGETVTVTFTAPSTPGDYTYVCTFPGHFVSGMKGVLTVQ